MQDYLGQYKSHYENSPQFEHSSVGTGVLQSQSHLQKWIMVIWNRKIEDINTKNLDQLANFHTNSTYIVSTTHLYQLYL